MTHRDRCRIQDPNVCMGCKVEGLGYDSRTFTRTIRTEAGNERTEHRSGRVDVRINAKAVQYRAAIHKPNEVT